MHSKLRVLDAMFGLGALMIVNRRLVEIGIVQNIARYPNPT